MISSMKQKLFALFAAAVLLLGMSACKNEDNPSDGETTYRLPPN